MAERRVVETVALALLANSGDQWGPEVLSRLVIHGSDAAMQQTDYSSAGAHLRAAFVRSRPY